MLNLVQIQDKLKDMPTRAIMAYANGQNPMVPPYLALGELNRRKQMEQSAMGEQARQGGEPPTIKQATEEQLGLMQLQKGRAMQAQQNMGQAMASAPSPVPAGVGEEPVQMAGGGLARLPVRNIHRQAYAGGGIVAFADNQDQPVSEDMPSNYIDPELERKKRQAAMWERVKSSDKPYLAEDFREDVSKLLDPLVSFLTMKDAKELEKAKKLQTADKPGDYPMYTPLPPKQKADEVVERVTEKVVEKPKSGIASVAPQKQPAAAPLTGVDKYEAELKKRGLDVMPDSSKGIEALRKQTEMYEKPIYSDWTEGLLGTVQDIRSGQAIGTSRARQEKENKQALADLNLKIAAAEDLKVKSDYEFKRGNFDKAVEYERKAQELANQAMTARAQMISATKSPAEIQMIERVMKEKGLSFTDAIKEMNLEKGMAARLKSAQDKWNSDIATRMMWEKKGGYNAYLQSEGLPAQSISSPSSGANSALISKADQIISGKK